ncbi:hypothetical protein CBR_g21197 [Chara braunii]|uniref:Reverse transcriptase domain-containing protein n=1 Tax=Chara braunii TaxID=69332 RepID=A0A388L0Y5_CHABU|nr:hypothetical protein CBR_g21197 [Chara braunii]|eukprot:GBG75955.1 hypothetical protein CBR_g21197 [Chara braunii]
MVYVPSEPAERKSFLQELPYLLPDAQNIVLAGDFNTVLSPGLDSPNFAFPKADARQLMAFIEESGYIDAYRQTHPTEHSFTWFSSQKTDVGPPPKLRLDLMLTKGSAWDSLICIDVIADPLSDHRPLLATFETAAALARGPGIFRLNVELLEHQEVLSWVENHWRDWEQTKGWLKVEEEWVQLGFRMITRALDVFSRVYARGRRLEEEESKRQVEEAERMLETQPLVELHWERRRQTWLQKWDQLQIQQQSQWAKRAAERGIVGGDRITKETFKRLAPPRSHTLFRELEHPFLADADAATTTEAIGNYAPECFQDILTSRRPPGQTLQQLREEYNLWQDTDVALPNEARLLLDRPVTVEELTETLKAMAKGKSPGVDGLPAEFYTATWDYTVPILVKLYNHVLEGGSLREDKRRGVITLIYKKGDKRNIRNFRPISRLNVSYKLLAKLLARRMAPFLPALVHTDQGAFVQGRAIEENIFTAMGALEIIQRENRQVMVAMLNLKKAYDRVNWSFVLATLEHMNFGIGFRTWVAALYTDTTASVLVNGYQSPLFSLTRSLRQGCPLASLLFATQMDVFLNSIRSSPCIKGLQLGPEHTLTTGAIANDLLLVAEAQYNSLAEIKRLLDIYAQLSEAQVNWRKSLCFLPEEYQLEDDWGMTRVGQNLSERFLGVQISLTCASRAQDTILKAKVQAKQRLCRAAPGFALFGRAMVMTTLVFSQLWYVAAVLLLSKPMLRGIKKDASRYLWKPGAQEDEGFITKCAWQKITCPTDEGGLGILDPEAQNLALLFKWFIKACTQPEQRKWLAVFEYLAQQEFHLARPEDIWTCILMDSYVRRQPASPLLTACSAWRALSSFNRKESCTREEVLRQPLFDNCYITDDEALPLSATSTRGSFGRRWVEKGIDTVGDLWDDSEEEWIRDTALRDTLGKLRYVERRKQQIIQAIPQHWRTLLQTKQPVQGQWYLGDTQGQQTVFLKIGEQLDEDTLIAQEWTAPVMEVLKQGLQFRDTISLSSTERLQLVRVHTSQPRPGVYHHEVLLAGRPLVTLRIDPLVGFWRDEEGKTVPFCCYSSKLARNLLSKNRPSPAAVASKLSSSASHTLCISEIGVRGLWIQLPNLPSRKLAALLWMVSHAIVPTTVWLFERGMDIATKCSRCGGRAEETISHLIWTCPASKRIRL